MSGVISLLITGRIPSCILNKSCWKARAFDFTTDVFAPQISFKKKTPPLSTLKTKPNKSRSILQVLCVEKHANHVNERNKIERGSRIPSEYGVWYRIFTLEVYPQFFKCWFWGWDWNPQSYRNGFGFLGYESYGIGTNRTWIFISFHHRTMLYRDADNPPTHSSKRRSTFGYRTTSQLLRVC